MCKEERPHLCSTNIHRPPAADFCVWCKGARGWKVTSVDKIEDDDNQRPSLCLTFSVSFSKMIWNTWRCPSSACLAQMLQVLLLYSIPLPTQTTHDWRIWGCGMPKVRGFSHCTTGPPCCRFMFQLHDRIYMCWTSVFPSKNSNPAQVIARVIDTTHYCSYCICITLYTLVCPGRLVHFLQKQGLVTCTQACWFSTLGEIVQPETIRKWKFKGFIYCDSGHPSRIRICGLTIL